MNRIVIALSAALALVAAPGFAAGEADQSNPAGAVAAPQTGDTALKGELDQLRQKITDLEQKLNEQGKQNEQGLELSGQVKELDQRVSKTELNQAVDRVHITGDYRFEAHAITGNIPARYDGMALQNLVVKTMFAMPILGRMPSSVSEIQNTVAQHYSDYQYFTNNLTFAQLKTAMGSFPAAMQQQLFGMLMPSTYTGAYKNDNDALFTNRLRLNISAKVADNISFSGRLSMYKVFGDSTGVQVFNGQANTLNSDGTTATVPNSDQLRVERAYFSWNSIGGSPLYLSIGRRPSTGGPPMNFREDELRGGTPSGALIDYQFDGITAGYVLGEATTLRVCWGLGYESGFGNGNLLKMPQDRLKDTHFLGANVDVWNTEETLIQATYAHAFNVADGFNGLMVLPVNPLTGDAVNAPVVMRYTPSANLGAINLFGMNFSRHASAFDVYGSANYSGTKPNGTTTPFGGLMSDPFETPVDRSGYMILAGLRYNFPNDGYTKLGFEYNHGSKYWFNFAQASDDIVAPKTNTRGDVYETYLTHRINDHFIFKADFIKYLYDYSGSGWHVGAPKALNSTPILGFPSYDSASMFTAGVTARF